MAEVFISYAGESGGAVAAKAADALEKIGISCWYQGRDMKPDEFAGVITRAIRKCRVFLLIMDREAESSKHVESEIALAFRRILNYETLSMLVFRVDGCELSLLLRPYGVIDGNPPDEKHIRALRDRVARILNREKSPMPYRAAEQAK